MGFEVRHALSQAERDPRVVGIVITGAGRGFCAGADMNRLTAVSAAARSPASSCPRTCEADPGDPAFGDDLHLGTHTYLMSVPKPVIAAINGPAAGMAVPIVLACDLRFMAEDAIIMTAFAQRGLIAEWGLSWLLPRLVGPAAALDLLFSSRKVSGTEAASMGLVNASLPRADVLAHAQQYVRDLAATSSPTSMAIMKRQVYQQVHAGLLAAEREAVQLMMESFGRPDFGEGVRSFVERRPPKFERLPQLGRRRQDRTPAAGILDPMAHLPLARHLLRAKDLADARYPEPLTVPDLAAAAGLSPAHFSREFKRAFGESPHQYLLTRRLERAAALLRTTDWSVADICFAVGAGSVGSFTVSFGRIFGRRPQAYRAKFPPARVARAHPALRRPGVRAPAEPHVSRRPGRSRLPRLSE